MGLKLRRLKNGFAYYAEYKFGGRCVYESIEAKSAREAKRRYAARRKELLHQFQMQAADASANASINVREAGDSQINAVLAALLRALVARRVFSDAEIRDLLSHAFGQIDLASGSITAIRARESIRQALLAEISEAPPATHANADRVRLVPSEF